TRVQFLRVEFANLCCFHIRLLRALRSAVVVMRLESLLASRSGSSAEVCVRRGGVLPSQPLRRRRRVRTAPVRDGSRPPTLPGCPSPSLDAFPPASSSRDGRGR